MSIATGTKALDFFENPHITYETDEGDLTVNEDVEVWHDGSEDITFSFASKISKGNLVTITANNRVEHVAVQDNELLGIAATKARPGKGTRLIPPIAAVYTNVFREVSVEIYGLYARTVITVAASTAATLGLSIIHDVNNSTRDEWEGRATLANTNYVTNIESTTVCTAVFMYTGKMDAVEV